MFNNMSKNNILIKYNYNFLTTYRSFDEENSDLCYKIQLLQAFNMQKYDDFILQENMKKIYYYMRENVELKNIYELLSKTNTHFEFMKELILNDKTNNELPQDIVNIFFFQILFSYDYFDIMHKCLSKYLNDLFKYKKENEEEDEDEYKESLKNTLYFEELKEFIMNH